MRLAAENPAKHPTIKITFLFVIARFFASTTLYENAPIAPAGDRISRRYATNLSERRIACRNACAPRRCTCTCRHESTKDSRRTWLGSFPRLASLAVIGLDAVEQGQLVRQHVKRQWHL